MNCAIVPVRVMDSMAIYCAPESFELEELKETSTSLLKAPSTGTLLW